MRSIEMILVMFTSKLAECDRLAAEAVRAYDSATTPETREAALAAVAFFQGAASAYEREIGEIREAIEFKREVQREAREGRGESRGEGRGESRGADYDVN